ncbi:hypothetical protein RHSIM_Rhsim02G0086600 [Rhododendron simsii]|uniref:Reverse transcriptase domain-containing protein n=1 Tax=Rhododendron simsii TaxID=118357 RepID=A0A834LWP6_RHOSS|nr:hypothetical protein RHSIM_Rhsim02G0086600 [Rhododendron simsii]
MEKGKRSSAVHVLAIPYPSQGHLNPMLQFCRRLVSKGLKATLAITTFISNTTQPKSDFAVQLDTISDGYDEGGFEQAGDTQAYVAGLEAAGSKTLAELIKRHKISGHPVDCVIYDAFLPWALDVAKQHGIAGAAFFTQPCAVNYIYHHAHHGLLALPVPSFPVSIPGLPLLELEDMPSYIYVHGSYPAYFEMVLSQFSNVEKADYVVVNTFYKLEEKERNPNRLIQIRTPTQPKSDSVQLDAISDGYDEGRFKQAGDVQTYLARLEAVGSKTLAELTRGTESPATPLIVSFMTHSYLGLWILLTLPVLSLLVSIPGLPLLELEDMPSFIYMHGSYPAYFEMVLSQFSNMEKPDYVVVNTFYKLEEKSAFVGGRQISDSILIAHEIMHSLKNRRNGRKGWVALKLDMAKAFDRIEWSYLEAVLRKFGFNETWIRWVMSCVTTVSFATLINGEKGELFTPSRGIRQGCPLSPYLFILCAEGFHYLIQRAIMNSSLNGVKIGQHCPSISHLFFVDDSLLFWEATSFGCYAIDEILRKYEIASGQMVNGEKSSLFFSPNTPADVKQGISEALNICFENHGGKYLGLPSIIGRSKTGVFQYVKDRVIAKLKSWKDTVLNLAGKETMLKSVAMTMPNFIMQCFLLPKRGGLGFRDFHDFNIAFLAKQGWRLINGPESLFQRLFKGKYFHYSTFWDASCPKSASWAWRSICAGRSTLRKGWRWCVGDGKAISIWHDPWLPRSLSFHVLSPAPPVDSLYHSVTRVSDLIDERIGVGFCRDFSFGGLQNERNP